MSLRRSRRIAIPENYGPQRSAERILLEGDQLTGSGEAGGLAVVLGPTLSQFRPSRAPTFRGPFFPEIFQLSSEQMGFSVVVLCLHCGVAWEAARIVMYVWLFWRYISYGEESPAESASRQQEAAMRSW